MLQPDYHSCSSAPKLSVFLKTHRKNSQVVTLCGLSLRRIFIGPVSRRVTRCRAAAVVVGLKLSPSPNWTQSQWPFLITSLTKASTPQLFNLAGQAAVRRVLVNPNFFHMIIIFFETINAEECLFLSFASLAPALSLNPESSSFNLINLIFRPHYKMQGLI